MWAVGLPEALILEGHWRLLLTSLDDASSRSSTGASPGLHTHGNMLNAAHAHARVCVHFIEGMESEVCLHARLRHFSLMEEWISVCVCLCESLHCRLFVSLCAFLYLYLFVCIVSPSPVCVSVCIVSVCIVSVCVVSVCVVSVCIVSPSPVCV